MKILRQLKNLWRLASHLDVVKTEEGFALVPVGDLAMGSGEHPFESLSVDKDTVSVYARKDGVNFERFSISYDQVTNHFVAAAQAGGTGQLRPIRFTTRDDITQLILNADGTVDIPGLGTLRYDIAQGLTAEQQARLRANLGL